MLLTAALTLFVLSGLRDKKVSACFFSLLSVYVKEEEGGGEREREKKF